MLKFELTRFEAQDVITTSGVAASPCKHSDFTVDLSAFPTVTYECNDCDATGTSYGSIATTDTIVWNK